MNHEEFLYNEVLKKVDRYGHLNARENTILEFKEHFNFSRLQSYAKAMAAFSNNKGGYIIFGVADSPRKPVGINKEVFDSIEIETITDNLNSFFSPEIVWDINRFEYNKLYFGYIYTYESRQKPVICTKNSQELKESDIYYRYRGQSRKATYSELKTLLDGIKINERNLWMRHIEKIGKIGINNLALINFNTGDIEPAMIDEGNLVIDKGLLDDLISKVDFIEEGKFSEVDGSPVLKVLGKIQSTSGILVPKLDPDKDFPYRLTELSAILGINRYKIQILIWKYNIKGNKNYHLEIHSGDNSLHKYSNFALDRLKEIINEVGNDEVYYSQLSWDYTAR